MIHEQKMNEVKIVLAEAGIEFDEEDFSSNYQMSLSSVKAMYAPSVWDDLEKNINHNFLTSLKKGNTTMFENGKLNLDKMTKFVTKVGEFLEHKNPKKYVRVNEKVEEESIKSTDTEESEKKIVDFSNPEEKKAFFDEFYDGLSSLETREEKIKYLEENLGVSLKDLSKQEKDKTIDEFEIRKEIRKIKEDIDEEIRKKYLELDDDEIDKLKEYEAVKRYVEKKGEDFEVRNKNNSSMKRLEELLEQKSIENSNKYDIEISKICKELGLEESQIEQQAKDNEEKKYTFDEFDGEKLNFGFENSYLDMSELTEITSENDAKMTDDNTEQNTEINNLDDSLNIEEINSESELDSSLNNSSQGKMSIMYGAEREDYEDKLDIHEEQNTSDLEQTAMTTQSQNRIIKFFRENFNKVRSFLYNFRNKGDNESKKEIKELENRTGYIKVSREQLNTNVEQNAHNKQKSNIIGVKDDVLSL